MYDEYGCAGCVGYLYDIGGGLDSEDAAVIMTSLSDDSEAGCGAEDGGGVGVGNVLGVGPEGGGSLLVTLLLLLVVE